MWRSWGLGRGWDMLRPGTVRAALWAAVSLLALGVSPASADLLPVVNPSFEQNEFGEYGYDYFADGWTITGDAGTFNPGEDSYPGADAPDGINVGFVQSGWVHPTGSLEQTLSTVIEADRQYTLRVMIGRRLENPLLPWLGYTASLWAGPAMLVIDNTRVTPAQGAWALATVTYTATEISPALGMPLTIRFESHFGQTNFDLVEVERSIVPTPGVAATLGLAGLAGLRRRR